MDPLVRRGSNDLVGDRFFLGRAYVGKYFNEIKFSETLTILRWKLGKRTRRVSSMHGFTHRMYLEE